jgi:CheY-like chemotaxis protein
MHRVCSAEGVGVHHMALRAEDAETDQLPLTILVVEDDPLARLSVAGHLRDIGYSVVEAGTADDAVAVLRSGTPVHLVFCDVELPGQMGGFSFAVWMRNHHRSIPVILTSGVGSVIPTLDRQHLIPFLRKPYRPEEAAELIASVIVASPAGKKPE